MAKDMAQKETAVSQEQRSSGNTLPVSRDSEDEVRGTSSEVTYKNTEARRDSDMAPPDLEASNESKSPLNAKTAQNGLETGQGEDDGARVVQQAKVHDLSLKGENFESEQSLEAVTQEDVQSEIDQLQKIVGNNRAESQQEMDDFTQDLQVGKTQSDWIVHRVRRTIVDVIIARATATCTLEDYRAMETHVLNAIEMARSLSQTSLYESLLKRCQYLMGVALYYQQRFQDADNAFEKAGNCPAASGISLRAAKEWRHVIREALQASRTSSLSLASRLAGSPVPELNPERLGSSLATNPATVTSNSRQRENVAHPEPLSALKTQTESPALFPARKLSNILEEVEAGKSSNNSADSAGEYPREQAFPSLDSPPLIPKNDPWVMMPEIFQRRQSLNGSASARLSLLRSATARSAFGSGRSMAASNASYPTSAGTSMKEDDILAAFGGGGGGGEYQSHTNTPTSLRGSGSSWGSGYEREEITVGDDLRKQRWAAWEMMKRYEDELFKRDELRFKDMMRRKYEEQRKDPEWKKDQRFMKSKRFLSDIGYKMAEDVRKSEDWKKKRRGRPFRRGQ